MLVMGAPRSGKSTWCRHMSSFMSPPTSDWTTATPPLSWQDYSIAMIPLLKRYTIMMIKAVGDMITRTPSLYKRKNEGEEDDEKKVDQMNDVLQAISQLNPEQTVVAPSTATIIEVHCEPLSC
jgi:adenosyl cobinamide kinase/adenosyl cobinamide phosphate guanylyltransferase